MLSAENDSPVERGLCNSCKSFAYSLRSTRETLDTVLFTIRKFVFTHRRPKLTTPSIYYLVREFNGEKS